ncbi:MAG: hypothetical protein ABFD08_11855, partial [Syntrophomonas sp.]
MKRRIIKLTFTLCMLISLMACFAITADAAAETVYPYYVITRGETATDYFYVYKQTDSAGSFEAFTTSADVESNTAYSAIDIAVSAVTAEVSS